MDLHLQDHVAFVAGSSRGIGRAIAVALLNEGARIVLTGRDADSLSQTHRELATTPELHRRILSLTGNFSDPDTIEDALNVTVSHFGHIDHLVANLGTGSGKPGYQQLESEWIRLFDANFFSSVRLAQAAIRHLQQRAGVEGACPSLLFISSIVAVEATPAPLPYSAAKAALNNYSKNLARQLAPEKIRVNTICPGNIYFPGGSWDRHLHNRREAVEEMLATEVPLARFGTPEEIASLAAYLCSPAASFSTGSTYIMDGGQTRSL